MATRKLRIRFITWVTNLQSRSTYSLVSSQGSISAPCKHPILALNLKQHGRAFTHCINWSALWFLVFTSPTLIVGIISTAIRHHKHDDFIKAPLIDSDMYEARCYTTQSNTLSPCDNWNCWITVTQQLKVISYLDKVVWPPPGLQLSYFFLESDLPSTQKLLQAPSYYSRHSACTGAVKF